MPSPSRMPKIQIVDAEPERSFQARVVELARLLGWRVYHSRPAMYRSGRWATPLIGDSGLPDLILCKPPRLIFAELKREKGKVSTAQQGWLDALSRCAGVEVYVWRPRDWQAIVDTLRSREIQTQYTSAYTTLERNDRG